MGVASQEGTPAMGPIEAGRRGGKRVSPDRNAEAFAGET